MNQFLNLTSRVLRQTAASLLLASGFFLSALDGQGQEMLTITFEGPPSVPPATGIGAPEYIESGVRF